MLDTMYRQKKAVQSRSDKGWKRRSNSGGQRRFGQKNNYGQRRKHTAQKIDPRLFINKAEKVQPKETVENKNTINSLAINSQLKESVKNRGYTNLTPIQDKIIPLVLEGRDVIGLANTGTGKTAAFLIPIIHKILSNPKDKTLVVVPTRELATQIQDEFSAFVRKLNLHCVVVVGGASTQMQIKQLQRPHNLIIGTPGRLKDLIARKKLSLAEFNNVVLDEADRMLDMGFVNDIKLLLSLVSSKRQMMLFSATFSKEIDNIVKNFLVNPEKISLKTKATSKQIEQDVIRVQPGSNKDELLHDLLNQNQLKKVLIFTRTKRGADKLSKNLHFRGFKAEAIHGDKPHNKRQKVLKMFKSNAFNILVATDVAARGLDIPNVSHVINYDLPENHDDYIHRIGRTGRADQPGTALTFIS
ncbi:MAG: DEAD/DEAH box helicase [Candidatus Moraniibacteriota bacterium]